MVTIRDALSIFPLAALLLGAGVVYGQSYPNRPIRMLSTEPGGFLDITARLIAQEIASPLGQPVIVENRVSTLQPEIAARATPDGYTVALASGTTWLTPLIQKTSYDVLKDFSPITLVVTYPYVLVVHPSVPIKSAKELIDLAKAKPGVLNIAAAASPGGQSFLAAELFKAMAGVNMVRVPYKGNEAALVAVMAGEAQLMFIAPASAMPNAKVGKLRVLAVTSLEPTPLVPGMPTLSAVGVPGYECLVVAGILAPGGTPAAIINRLNQEIVRVLGRADVKEKFFNNAADSAGSSPAEFAAKIKSEIAKWGKVLKDAGVKPES